MIYYLMKNEDSEGGITKEDFHIRFLRIIITPEVKSTALINILCRSSNQNSIRSVVIEGERLILDTSVFIQPDQVELSARHPKVNVKQLSNGRYQSFRDYESDYDQLVALKSAGDKFEKWFHFVKFPAEIDGNVLDRPSRWKMLETKPISNIKTAFGRPVGRSSRCLILEYKLIKV